MLSLLQTLISNTEMTTTASTAKKKEKKEQLTKAQKRRIINRTGIKFIAVIEPCRVFKPRKNDSKSSSSDMSVSIIIKKYCKSSISARQHWETLIPGKEGITLCGWWLTISLVWVNCFVWCG